MYRWLNEEERLGGPVGREPSEDILFKQELGSLGAFYSHPNTPVFMLTAFPADYYDPQEASLHAAVYIYPCIPIYPYIHPYIQ